jgi:hypothetical protein
MRQSQQRASRRRSRLLVDRERARAKLMRRLPEMIRWIEGLRRTYWGDGSLELFGFACQQRIPRGLAARLCGLKLLAPTERVPRPHYVSARAFNRIRVAGDGR